MVKKTEPFGLPASKPAHTTSGLLFADFYTEFGTLAAFSERLNLLI